MGALHRDRRRLVTCRMHSSWCSTEGNPQCLTWGNVQRVAPLSLASKLIHVQLC